MRRLTPSLKTVYSVTTTAKSVVGFGDLNHYKGVNTPQTLVGVFLFLQGSFLAVCIGSATFRGSAAELPLCSVRQPNAHCLHLLARVLSVFGKQTKDNTMNDLFVLNKAASNQQLISYSYIQLTSVLSVLNQTLELCIHADEMKAYHNDIYNLLDTARILSEQIGMCLEVVNGRGNE